MSEIRRWEERPHELVLDLPAAHSAGRMGRQLVRQFAESEGLPEKEVETLEFVTSELLSNAVDHGGGKQAMEVSDIQGDVRMSLELKLEEGRWHLKVGDQGGGDPEEVKPFLDSNELPDLEDERGRGFFLLLGMLDQLSVDRSGDGLGLVFIAVKAYESPSG